MSVPMPARGGERARLAAEAFRALTGSAARPGPAWRRDALGPRAIAGFVASYLVIAELSGQLSTALDVSPWYPPAGLSLAAVLIFGRRAIPMVAVADALQLIVRGQDGVLESIAQGLAQAAFWGAAGLLLRPQLLAESPLSRMRELAWFALIGVALGPIVAGVAGVLLLSALHSGYGSDFAGTAQVYAIGDSIGILSLTPTLLVLSGWARHRAAAWRAVRHSVAGHGLEGWAMAALTLAVPVATVALWQDELLPFASLPIAWVAVRRGMPTAAIALGVWSASAVVAFAAGGGEVSLREISALMISTGLLSLSVGAIVTERERGRARMAYLALHDDVTGLPNRLGFTERVADALRRTDRGDLAVLTVRLDLHAAPDAIDPELLDRILQRAAHRLRRLTSPDATIARVGDGRFVLLVDGPDAQRVEQVAARIVSGLERPVVLDHREYLLGPVVGHVLGSTEADPEELLAQAERAADAASPQTRNQAGYDEGMRRADDRSRTLGDELRQAIDAGGLHLCFQPIVDAGDRHPIGAEALLRWDHPERGAVGPAEFIPVAEACGLILPLGRWVLEEACRQAAAWPRAREGGGPLVVHVNLSPVQLRDEGLTAFVAATLRESGLAAGRLCLELTESALFDDLDVAAARIEELTGLGVAVVLDDFGTGASSLSWLQRLPVTALKIDRSFVSGVGERSVDTAIVTATLGLARAIGMDTVAEGVETEEQLGALRELGCPTIQGFLICRPIRGDALVKWFATPALAGPVEPVVEPALLDD